MNAVLHIFNKFKYLAQHHGLEFKVYPDITYPENHIIAVGDHSYSLDHFSEEAVMDAYIMICAKLEFERYKQNDLKELLNVKNITNR